MARLQELLERRAYACRLTPDRALESLDEAEAFLRDRGLLTRTTDCALPSLYDACHEEPYAAGKAGFAQWPKTKWPWFGALEQRPGTYRLHVHRGKHLLVTDAVAAILDPICRSELARTEASDPRWALVLRHLADAGPSTTEDLCTELGFKPKDLKKIRSPLERCGAVVTRWVDVHDATVELARWDQVYTEPSASGGIRDLVVAGVRAAVVAPEGELRRWFSWRWLWDDALVDTLVAEGRLERVDGHVTAAERAS